MALNDYKMVYVKGGTFRMGSNSLTAPGDEHPAHKVTLGDFYIGQTPVTQALWEEVMGDNPSSHIGKDLPVNNVSWNTCQEFIKKLNKLTGKKYRLPIEAEWEYAARGGLARKGFKYPGSNRINDVGWYRGNSEEGRPHPVKMKSPNDLGIYDMAGSIWEWCYDKYKAYDSALQGSEEVKRARVLRGGSWYVPAKFCRASCRGYFSPNLGCVGTGLRLAMSSKD